jgi:hypothetical protein
MKIFLWIVGIVIAALAVVMLIAFVGRGPSLSRAESSYCEDLAAYGRAVVDLRAIDENSTVDELKEAQKAIQNSWEELRQSSQALRQARLEVVESSFNELEQTINGVSDRDTLAQAKADIYRTALEGAAQTLDAQRVVCSYQAEAER